MVFKKCPKNKCCILIIVLLIVSVVFNVFLYNENKEIKDNINRAFVELSGYEMYKESMIEDLDMICIYNKSIKETKGYLTYAYGTSRESRGDCLVTVGLCDIYFRNIIPRNKCHIEGDKMSAIGDISSIILFHMTKYEKGNITEEELKSKMCELRNHLITDNSTGILVMERRTWM